MKSTTIETWHHYWPFNTLVEALRFAADVIEESGDDGTGPEHFRVEQDEDEMFFCVSIMHKVEVEKHA
ncbi:MAG: hypothetical protein MJH10_19585 [Epibacterium sp.]|nr:hypothetical protein [Epibacterium sp.]NQX75687.1 hypothetical protein [Epibacterium sp.]